MKGFKLFPTGEIRSKAAFHGELEGSKKPSPLLRAVVPEPCGGGVVLGFAGGPYFPPVLPSAINHDRLAIDKSPAWPADENGRLGYFPG